MQKILLCIDPDPQPSVFDAVVAVDAGVDQLLRHGGVTPDQVEGLVHGAMFTRGPSDLRHTAIFVGGSSVEAAEELLRRATGCFFGPMRVSVLLDANGANTTAAAAVIAARRHIELGAGTVAVVIGTGPVGQRAARMLAGEGVEVRIASRTLERATQLCHTLAQSVEGARFLPCSAAEQPLESLIEGAHALIAAGPAGVEVMDEATRGACSSLRVVVDLNAVPPTGVGGVEPTDKAVKRGAQTHYGALGVGGMKMKLHKAALARLFETSDAVLDADEVFALGKELEAAN